MNSAYEALAEPLNPIGLDGIEFVEYTTPKPQALGQILETMGFRPVAKHRSREVLLYRQGEMNIVINAEGQHAAGGETGTGRTGIAAVAYRVRDAAAAYERALARGAWAVPTHVEVMELNIPAIHGPGATRIFFVDRYKEFSIYSVDFIPIPDVDQHPPAISGLHWFGLVHYIYRGRTEDWTEFYHELLGFDAIPDTERFGILPKGRILRSPCRKVYFQLIEPEPSVPDLDGDEQLARVGLGAPDVPAAVAALQARGIEFMQSGPVHADARGAITRSWLGGVMFELVHNER